MSLRKEDIIDKPKLGDAVGMPDDQDRQNLSRLVKKYNRDHPGEIAALVRDSKRRQKEFFANEFGSSGTSGGKIHSHNVRWALSIPIQLLRDIEEGYPLMFENKHHMHWFMKNFPEFKRPAKV